MKGVCGSSLILLRDEHCDRGYHLGYHMRVDAFSNGLVWVLCKGRYKGISVRLVAAFREIRRCVRCGVEYFPEKI